MALPACSMACSQSLCQAASTAAISCLTAADSWAVPGALTGGSVSRGDDVLLNVMPVLVLGPEVPQVGQRVTGRHRTRVQQAELDLGAELWVGRSLDIGLGAEIRQLPADHED